VTGSGGRLHFGMVADIKSERRPTSNRNPRPDCVGIRIQRPDHQRRDDGGQSDHCTGAVNVADDGAWVRWPRLYRLAAESEVAIALPEWVRRRVELGFRPRTITRFRVPPIGREPRQPDLGDQSKARERCAISISIRHVRREYQQTGRSESRLSAFRTGEGNRRN
jgi:hypothetical protein